MQKPSPIEPPNDTPRHTHDFGFGKSHRLLTAGEFKAIFDNAQIKAQHPTMLILARPNAKNAPRLGLVVAKKNIKKAVRRNRFKRLVRESFRNQQRNLPSIDVIVLARRDADTIDNDKLLSILSKLWHRVSKNHAKLTGG